MFRHIEVRTFNLKYETIILLFIYEFKFRNPLASRGRSAWFVHGCGTGFAIWPLGASSRLRRNGRGALWLCSKTQSRQTALDRPRLFRSLRRSWQHVSLCLAALEWIRFADFGDQ